MNEVLERALVKIKAAQVCHPNAVMTLLSEAEEIMEEALAQSEQEPVARVQFAGGLWKVTLLTAVKKLERSSIHALYTTPPQPEQEPVAWANPHDLQNFDMKVRTNGGPLHTVPLYLDPPQRTWVGLTLKEILDTYRGPDGSDYVEYARGLEAKLKEKNT